MVCSLQLHIMLENFAYYTHLNACLHVFLYLCFFFCLACHHVSDLDLYGTWPESSNMTVCYQVCVCECVCGCV